MIDRTGVSLTVPTTPRTPSLSDWLARLGVAGIDTLYLLAAVTHPSYRSLDSDAESYERLEFLGDAVINLVVADLLFRTIPSAPEGVLTERRAALVSRDALAVVFDSFGLVRFLRASPGYVPSLKDKGNVVEALFGAVLVGKGFDACHTLWLALSEALPPHLGAGAAYTSPIGAPPLQLQYQDFYKSLGISLIPAHNAKNALQELCQKQGLPPPVYQEVTRTGPDHRPQFLVHLRLPPFVSDKTVIFEATGEGLTRKAAEIRAAERLCAQISLPFLPQT